MHEQDRSAEPRCARCHRRFDHVGYYFPAVVAATHFGVETPVHLCYRCLDAAERTFVLGLLRQNAEVEEMMDREAVDAEWETQHEEPPLPDNMGAAAVEREQPEPGAR